MKQIYATGTLHKPAAWKSADTPAPGRNWQLPTVKASTHGVNAETLQAVLPHAFYAVPPADPTGTDPERPLPIRLALLKTTSGRVLTHAVPHGDSYFAHSLLNVPETADAQLAIQTWSSPQWQRTAPESPSDLPELPYLPVTDVLDDASLKSWLETPYKRELLEFALTALLTMPTTTSIYLNAAADDVAKAIYAITRALPAGLLDTLTFSTFESDPLACNAKIIGHDSGSAERDLPEACYRTGAALNSFTGKRSDLNATSPFAAFAVQALASGEFAALDDLKTTWQRLGLKEAKQFDLVYRLARGTGTLSKDEAAEALQHPPLAAWISARSDALHQFLDWALDDRAFANASFVRAVQSLRQKPDVLAKLAERVREAGLKAVKDGDSVRTANALEVVLPMAAPTKAHAVWGELVTLVTEPGQLAWEMRCFLLPRFIRYKQQQQPSNTTVDASFGKWLDVPTERLADLLALELPKAYQLEACRVSLQRGGEPTPALVVILARHPALVLTLLQARTPEAETRAVTLFECLQTEAPARDWFEEVIAHAADYTPALLNRFFESTLSANKLDADRLIRTQGERLLELFDGQSGLDRLGQQFLAVPPADVLNNRVVLCFLGKLREQPLVSETLKARLDAIKAVRIYLDAPHFNADGLKPLTDAFAVSPPALPGSAKADVFAAVVQELKARSTTANLQADLECAMTHLGSTLANNPTDFYENVLRDVRQSTPDFGRNANVVRSFLAVALGATHDSDLQTQIDGLDGHAFAVASDAGKRGGHKLLNDLDASAKAWPKSAQTKWGFLLAAVRPRQRWQRDLTCVAIGAAVTVAAFFVWSILQ